MRTINEEQARELLARYREKNGIRALLRMLELAAARVEHLEHNEAPAWEWEQAIGTFLDTWDAVPKQHRPSMRTLFHGERWSWLDGVGGNDGNE